MWKGWGRHAPGKESCECQGSKVRNWLGVCKEQKVIEKRIRLRVEEAKKLRSLQTRAGCHDLIYI